MQDASHAGRESCSALKLKCLNHLSFVVHDVQASTSFYEKILGFQLVKRPQSFNFNGAWLHNYGLGIHLIGGGPKREPIPINPRSEHMSFQADSSISEMQVQLEALGIPYLKEKVLEDGVCVTQLFFHDPDNMMIEICNCELLPVVLASAAARTSSLDARALEQLERMQQDTDHPMDEQGGFLRHPAGAPNSFPRPPSSSSSRSSIESLWGQYVTPVIMQ